MGIGGRTDKTKPIVIFRKCFAKAYKIYGEMRIEWVRKLKW